MSLKPVPIQPVADETGHITHEAVYHILVGVVEVMVGNAREMQLRAGKKTDKADARWIAEFSAHGLIRPGFVPPPETRAFRDLTRTRVGLVQTRTQAKNRVQKVLEDSNLKLASVVLVSSRMSLAKVGGRCCRPSLRANAMRRR